MPVMTGCELVQGFRERQAGSVEKRQPFLDANLQYPETAKKKGSQGKVYIGFTIDKDGSMQNPVIDTAPDVDLGAEALQIVQLMMTKNMRWIPGRERHYLVKVYYRLPIEFKIK